MTLLDEPRPTTSDEPAPRSRPASTPIEAAEEVDAAVEVNTAAGVGIVGEDEGNLDVAAFGPILGWSIAVASIIMFLGTGLPMLALTGSVWDGIGLGAFCAFWGGPGFGTMAAGAIWTLRCERAEHRSAPSAS